LADDGVDVVVLAVLPFGRTGVCRQIGRGDVDLAVGVGVYVGHDPELLELGLAVKTIPAFALDGGDAHGAHAVDEPQGLGL